ncbi:MAG: hypothetical protein IPJ41_06655 [Phycisphaerales bacterium]|nr:hypothetical protein [Phycisphaerales bacterium]
MQRPKPIPLLTAIVATVLVAVCCAMVAARIVRFNREHGRVVYAFLTLEEPEFSYAGREVRVESVPSAAPGDPGALTVTYGDDTLTFPVAIPPKPHTGSLPILNRNDDWFKIVRFAPLTGRSWDNLMHDMASGAEADRLVVVTRALRPGVNPDTWGSVWRKDWIFDFHEFQPGGGFSHERFAYPSSRDLQQLEARREEDAEHKAGLPELDSRSWEFQIADLLMPEGSAPRLVNGDSPLAAVGWWFPAAVVSVFAATGALDRGLRADPGPPARPGPLTAPAQITRSISPPMGQRLRACA